MISTEGTEYTISYAIAAYSATDEPGHRFQAATPDGQVISELHIDLHTLIITQVETVDSYRREGIATTLFEAAEKTLPQVLHSRPAHRTDEGHGWAEAVGGDTEETDDTDEGEDEDPWA